MKKLLTLAALLGAVSVSFGQGQLSFANTSATITQINTNTTVGGLGSSATRTSGPVGSYYYALFVSPTQTTVDTALTGWLFTGHYATNQASAGRLNGNATVDGVVINGVASGAAANFMVAGWSSNIGNDWGSARAYWDNSLTMGGVAQTGWMGFSGVGVGLTLGGGPNPVPALFGPGGATITGFTLGRIDPTAPIPEPSTFALAGLAGAAMLIFRRRK